MAKFLCEDDSIISYDRYVRQMHEKIEQPKISPVLKTELYFLEALQNISYNLKNNDTLDKNCIMQLIKGEKIECPFEGNCNKCITNWYVKSPK